MLLHVARELLLLLLLLLTADESSRYFDKVVAERMAKVVGVEVVETVMVEMYYH